MVFSAQYQRLGGVVTSPAKLRVPQKYHQDISKIQHHRKAEISAFMLAYQIDRLIQNKCRGEGLSGLHPHHVRSGVKVAVSRFVSFQQAVSLHFPPERGTAHAQGPGRFRPVLRVSLQYVTSRRNMASSRWDQG